MQSVDTKFSRSWWRKQFRTQANHPLVWELAAAQIEYAAEILLSKQRIDVARKASKTSLPPLLMSVILMLFGLAIEGLAKAILASKSSALNAQGEIAFKSHDLLKLARLAGLKVSKRDEHLLRKLTAFVSWAGRYPVPLSENGMQPFHWRDGSFAPIHGSMGGNDVKQARGVARRLARLLPGKGRRLRAGLRRFARLSRPSKRNSRSGKRSSARRLTSA